ncbi:MAG: hypothetical protein WCR46_13930 [Deltaproteobacteria bacterium]
MEERGIPSKYYGWWQIIETSQWDNDDIDIIGKAMISITGHEDRLRMFVLLAYVNCKVTKTGISFTWKGAWEYDPVSGTGSVKLRKDDTSQGESSSRMVMKVALLQRERRNRTSLSLIRQASVISSVEVGDGVFCRFLEMLI